MQSAISKSEKPEMVLDTDQIASQYGHWLTTMPFDVDEAVYNSFSALLENPRAKQAKNAAYQHNAKSLTASSLSRITPLAIWTSSLKNEKEIRVAIEMECQLTHDNNLVHDICYLYCVAIHSLLKHQDDQPRARITIDLITNIVKSKTNLKSTEKLEKWFDFAIKLSQQKNLVNAKAES